MRKLFVIAFATGLMTLMSCEKEVMVEKKTIAESVNIEAISGKVLQEGDTISIDQVKTKESWTNIRYHIVGLQEGQYVEVFRRVNSRPEEVLPIGESYEVFSAKNDTFIYSLSIDDFANVFDSKLSTTLKFKFSDGSEKWIINPVVLKIDSSLYKQSIELQSETVKDFTKTIVLNKGEGFYLTVWMDMKMFYQTYLRVVSENYFGGQYTGVGILPGYDEVLKSNTKEVYIPYEPNLTKRIVTIQLVGRYGQSEEKKFTVIWQ